MYRQGDVLLVPVGALPDGACPSKVEGARIVLALGEATGHAHAIATPGVGLYEGSGERFVSVPEGGAALTHEEHGPIPLPQGLYRVVIQREYSPEEIRPVRD